MRGTLKEDDNFKRVYNTKDVIALQNIIKSINFNYKKSEEPIKIMWQVDKDLVLTKQHKNDIQK